MTVVVRARWTNDQSLVEEKNGSIVRTEMGYGWIAHSEAGEIQAFHRRTLDVSVNPHRPGWDGAPGRERASLGTAHSHSIVAGGLLVMS